MAALMSGVAFTAMGDIQPGYFGTTSALSSGKWVKIKVSATGMQQITPQQLAEWAGTICYEIMLSPHARVPVIYEDEEIKGKNANAE